MDLMEKVEKLRERANVSYEEAKAALEANNGDLLDAMVMLEREGKTEGPRQTGYSTSYEKQENYVRVEDKVREQRSQSQSVRKQFAQMIRRFVRVCLDNYFCVRKENEVIFKLPLILMVLILLLAWKIVLVVGIIALLFGVRYSFEGQDDMQKANDFMDSAGQAVENFKEGFRKE